MKTDEMVGLLGSSFKRDVAPYLNQGYPILTCISSTVGISEPVLQNEIFVYPNPCVTELYVTFAEQEKVNYFIYNTMGQIVLQGNLHESSTINVQPLLKGIYFLKIHTSNAVYGQKIIKI